MDSMRGKFKKIEHGCALKDKKIAMLSQIKN
jgi:hypothetical protein